MAQGLRKTLWAWLALFVACCLPLPLAAAEGFIVTDIRIEGLQRITEGTVQNYLPVGKGELLDQERARESVRALYQTEFFNDVTLLRDGHTLIVRVVERPAIASFEIEGADKLGDSEVRESLAKAGLAEGKMFQQSVLDQVENEIRSQYYANGRYGVSIDAKVDELPNNRVNVTIEVDEGDVTKIRRINIVGNSVFSEDELREQITLRERSLLRIFGSSTQYSQPKLFGDLESITAYYQDRGYINFRIEAVQVSVSPNREDMYITINVNEGELFKVGEHSFIGDLIADEAVLRKLIVQKRGDIFSRQKARLTSELLTNVLTNLGYAFAEVTPQPTVNEDSQTVDINYDVVPGRRVYVRRILFKGNDKTNDEVLRREMRLLEGDWFSTSNLQRSQARIARLPFVEDMNVDTKPVPGTDDLIDIEISIVERAPGSIQVGVGFSGSQGFLINGSVTHANFRGTGSRLSASVNRSETTDLVNVSYNDPYWTDDGIGRSVSVFFRKSDSLATTLNSNFATDQYGANLGFSFPLSENNSWSLGIGYRDTALRTFNSSSDQVLRFARENGTNFDTVTARVGWSRDTRNRGFFPTRGTRQTFGFNVATPLGDLEYYRATYDVLTHIPIWGKVTLAVDGSVGYGEAFGDTSSLPPFENFFAGGPTSVRGYRAASLGPLETVGGFPDDAFGGQFRTVAQAELIVPTPLKGDQRSTRLVLFGDAGNVFAKAEDFEVDELRTSAGVAFYWLTPILGLLRFSYAYPLNDQPGDRLDRFQFTFGTGF